MAAINAPGSKGGHKGVDNGELKYYWTKDPQGLAKWVNHEHPWTELYHHILKHVDGNVEKAKRIASAWYREVFGHMPNQEKKSLDDPTAETRATVSDKPWSGFSAADYTPEQWRAACLIDTRQGDPDSKSRYKLPVREPGGAINRNGAHAAASVLGGGHGGVQATPEQQKAAASKLVGIYRNELKEDPPESLMGLAGGTRGATAIYGWEPRAKVFAEEDHPRDPGGKFDTVSSAKDTKTTVKAQPKGKPKFLAKEDHKKVGPKHKATHRKPTVKSAKDTKTVKAPSPEQVRKQKINAWKEQVKKNLVEKYGMDEKAAKSAVAGIDKDFDQFKDEPLQYASGLAANAHDKGRWRLPSAEARYWDAATTARMTTPPFIKGASFKKSKGADPDDDSDDESMESCKAKYEEAVAAGDMEAAAKYKAKMAAMGGGRSASDWLGELLRGKYGEGPGGSQKGPSIKALKAQILQAKEDGDEEMVKALQAKLDKLQSNDGAPTDFVVRWVWDPESRKWNPEHHPRGPDGKFIKKDASPGGGGGKLGIPDLPKLEISKSDQRKIDKQQELVNKMEAGKANDLNRPDLYTPDDVDKKWNKNIEKQRKKLEDLHNQANENAKNAHALKNRKPDPDKEAADRKRLDGLRKQWDAEDAKHKSDLNAELSKDNPDGQKISSIAGALLGGPNNRKYNDPDIKAGMKKRKPYGGGANFTPDQAQQIGHVLADRMFPHYDSDQAKEAAPVLGRLAQGKLTKPDLEYLDGILQDLVNGPPDPRFPPSSVKGPASAVSKALGKRSADDIVADVRASTDESTGTEGAVDDDEHRAGHGGGWEEKLHPRDPNGKFAGAGGGGGGSHFGSKQGWYNDLSEEDKANVFDEVDKVLQYGTADEDEAAIADSIDDKINNGEPLNKDESDWLNDRLDLVESNPMPEAPSKSGGGGSGGGGNKGGGWTNELDGDSKQAIENELDRLMDVGDEDDADMADAVDKKMKSGQPLSKGEANWLHNALDDASDAAVYEGQSEALDKAMKAISKHRSARPSGRAVMRNLPVIRSATLAPSLVQQQVELERLAAPGGGVFVRASYRADRTDENSHIMTLRFSQFNNWYPIDSIQEGKFLERVAPGAFTKTIGERGGQIKVLFNHGKSGLTGEQILGKIVTLEERSDGAYAGVELFDTSYNRDLIPGLRAGVYGSSFMFNVMDDQWDDRPKRSSENPQGLPERTVRALRLLEFGPVTWPANPGTTAGLRSNTDTYCDSLRSNSPEVYNDLAGRFGEFRSATTLSTRNQDAQREAEDQVPTAREGDQEIEAAARTDAPDSSESHAEVKDPQTNSAETRRSRLILAGVINDAD